MSQLGRKPPTLLRWLPAIAVVLVMTLVSCRTVHQPPILAIQFSVDGKIDSIVVPCRPPKSPADPRKWYPEAVTAGKVAYFANLESELKRSAEIPTGESRWAVVQLKPWNDDCTTVGDIGEPMSLEGSNKCLSWQFNFCLQCQDQSARESEKCKAPQGCTEPVFCSALLKSLLN